MSEKIKVHNLPGHIIRRITETHWEYRGFAAGVNIPGEGPGKGLVGINQSHFRTLENPTLEKGSTIAHELAEIGVLPLPAGLDVSDIAPHPEVHSDHVRGVAGEYAFVWRRRGSEGLMAHHRRKRKMAGRGGDRDEQTLRTRVLRRVNAWGKRNQ